MRGSSQQSKSHPRQQQGVLGNPKVSGGVYEQVAVCHLGALLSCKVFNAHICGRCRLERDEQSSVMRLCIASSLDVDSMKVGMLQPMAS